MRAFRFVLAPSLFHQIVDNRSLPPSFYGAARDRAYPLTARKRLVTMGSPHSRPPPSRHTTYQQWTAGKPLAPGQNPPTKPGRRGRKRKDPADPAPSRRPSETATHTHAPSSSPSSSPPVAAADPADRYADYDDMKQLVPAASLAPKAMLGQEHQLVDSLQVSVCPPLLSSPPSSPRVVWLFGCLVVWLF